MHPRVRRLLLDESGEGAVVHSLNGGLLSNGLVGLLLIRLLVGLLLVRLLLIGRVGGFRRACRWWLSSAPQAWFGGGRRRSSYGLDGFNPS